MIEPQSTAEACPLCGGRGWVLAADGGAGTAIGCECRKLGLGARLLAGSGIPERYRHCRFENFETSHYDPATRDQLLRALAESRAYVESFLGADGTTRESGLLYVGPTGVGKTHLAAAVAIELIERRRVRVRFVEFTDLLHQIQATFQPNTPGSKSEILDGLAEAELLVLDELGAQKPTAWVQDVLYLIINARYVSRRPTIFTTNFRLDAGPRHAEREEKLDRGASTPGLESLGHRLQATLVSRLYEMARPILLDGVEDFRRTVRNLSLSSAR